MVTESLRRTSLRRAGLVLGVAGLLALTGCGTSDDAASTVTVTASASTVTVRPSEDDAKDPDVSATTAPTEEPDDDGPNNAARVRMPDVVCMNLQAAQNKIQEAGVFLSRSEDATGKGRQQIWDRNWIVVAQRPAAGAPIGEGDAVLAAVKYGEPHDCPDG